MATATLKRITSGALNLEFFNRIIDRIESIKPLAGEFVEIKDETDGKRITLDGFEIKELDVCKNGAPDKIKILVKKE